MDFKDCQNCYFLAEVDRSFFCVLADKLFSEVERCPNVREDSNKLMFEIYFSDLNYEAQRQMLEMFGNDFVEDGNYDVLPLAEYIQYKDTDLE